MQFLLLLGDGFKHDLVRLLLFDGSSGLVKYGAAMRRMRTRMMDSCHDAFRVS